jgi:hypothetical protein
MVAEIITPLRLVFWGALIYILHFNVGFSSGRSSFQIDILNDVIGGILITLGVFRLGNVRVNATYGLTMGFVKLFAFLSIPMAVLAHFSVPLESVEGSLLVLLEVAVRLLGIANLAATVAFCVAMRWLSASRQLALSEASWQTTTLLFLIVHAIPLCFFNLLGIATLALSDPFHVRFEPEPALLLVLVPMLLLGALIPVIHFFVSTSRMRREAEQREVLTEGQQATQPGAK